MGTLISSAVKRSIVIPDDRSIIDAFIAGKKCLVARDKLHNPDPDTRVVVLLSETLAIETGTMPEGLLTHELFVTFKGREDREGPESKFSFDQHMPIGPDPVDFLQALMDAPNSPSIFQHQSSHYRLVIDMKAVSLIRLERLRKSPGI